MHRSISRHSNPRVALAVVASLLGTASLVSADPAITVRVLDGAVRIQLQGSYAGARYMVSRSGPSGVWAPITTSEVLCTGDCVVRDATAAPGRTYSYRFDLTFGDGSRVSYGPYAVTVPVQTVQVRLSPNPGAGVTQVMLSIPGGPQDPSVQAEARVVDLQGRSVRLLVQGALARGVTAVSWDGRGDGGEYLRSGIYYLRFTSPLGSAVARVVRIR